MRQETMTSAERLHAAISLEKPDRVPIAPYIFNETIGGLTGHTQGEFIRDPQLARAAYLEVFDGYGGWDSALAYIGTILTVYDGSAPLEIRLPGVDLPDDYIAQYIEHEVMQIEDYEKICEMGFEQFYREDYLWRIWSRGPEEFTRLVESSYEATVQLGEELGQRGVYPEYGSVIIHPFFALSMMRSLIPFTEDLRYHPDLVERTIARMTDDLIAAQVPIVKENGIKCWNVTDERAGAFFYPPAIAERFWWPYVMKMVDAMWSEGIVTGFHIDTCWDANIPDFRKKLPKGSYLLELDSTSDIFAAKEVLRGHGALQGDVPAALFTLGEPEEVEAYVKRLIDEVGDDGGFILDAGCAMPPQTTPENLRAFLETGRTYELSKK